MALYCALCRSVVDALKMQLQFFTHISDFIFVELLNADFNQSCTKEMNFDVKK